MRTTAEVEAALPGLSVEELRRINLAVETALRSRAHWNESECGG